MSVKTTSTVSTSPFSTSSPSFAIVSRPFLSVILGPCLPSRAVPARRRLHGRGPGHRLLRSLGNEAVPRVEEEIDHGEPQEGSHAPHGGAVARIGEAREE